MSYSINCKSCGAPCEVELGKKFDCSFCGNQISINSDIFNDKIVFGGNSSDSSRFKNLISLILNSQKSGDFDLSFKYINDALEIDPKNSKLWELCAQTYLLTKPEKLRKKQYLNIKNIYEGFFNTSKKNSPVISLSINSLYKTYLNKYEELTHDKSINGKSWDSFSDESCEFLIGFILMSSLYFEVSNDINSLEIIYKELSGHSKQYWMKSDKSIIKNEEFCKKLSFDAIGYRNDVLQKIKTSLTDYTELDIKYRPEFKLSKTNGDCFIATSCYEDINHENVIFLRKFRDEKMLNNILGIFFIKIYYIVSPKIKIFLDRNNKVKYFTRIYFMDKIVKLLKN